MLLTIKKQVEETLEVKTPAYYIDWVGNFIFINEANQLIKVNPMMIIIWEPESSHYNEAVEEVIKRGKPCTKEDFEKAYAEAMAKIESAAGVVINS